MKKQPNLMIKSFVLALAFLAPVISASAQSSLKRQYEVLQAGAAATVKTSADRDAVIVSIARQGQPTHYYRAYPQAAAITVKIGERQDLFTYYIKSSEIVAPGFKFNVFEVKGAERRQRRDVAAIREQLEDDMRILRAVRGYDKSADVLLAELAYAVLTYDGSIMDGEPPSSISVTEATPTSRNDARDVKTLSVVSKTVPK